jgi:hypothetical protein
LRRLDGGATFSRMAATISEIQLRRLAEMTGAEKLAVAEELRTAAWTLKRAWLRSLHPEQSDAEVEDQVRRHFLDAGP